MLFGLGAGEVKVVGADWAGRRGAGFGLNGLGGVKALRSGPWIEAGGSRFSSEVPSAIPWVKGRVLSCAGLGVEAEHFIVLLGWGSRSTLRLATQVLVQLDLPFDCCFASTPYR